MEATNKDLSYWLALAHAPMQQVTRQLVANFTIEQIFTDAALIKSLPEKLSKYLKSPDWVQVNFDLTWQQQAVNHHIIPLNSRNYPPLLAEISDPPLVLFAKGNLTALLQLQIAIVGARKSTLSGESNAFAFSKELATQGIAITSGLAYGIDSAAHKGALAATAATIAVLAHGLDSIYPVRNQSLAQQILEDGALVTEYGIGVPPHPRLFPQRNRIIAGLSAGVLVVEAAMRSGSLITARCALENGRDVFAIPGSIHSPQARGVNHLLQQGAKLVQCVSEITEEISSIKGVVIDKKAAIMPTFTMEVAPKFIKAWQAMGFDVVDVSSLCSKLGLAPEKISAMLVEMELSGLISRVPGGYVRNLGETV